MNAPHRPGLWIFAGPNGAGKSSFVRRRQIGRRMIVINPDDIAAAIDGGRRNSLDIQVKAGRMAIQQRLQLLAQGRTFGMETTLTGRGELHLMEMALERSYKVNLVYIGLGDVEQSRSRVIARVRSGGHDVPDGDIGRRFSRSLENLPKAIATSTRAGIFDNSGARLRLLARIEAGRMRLAGGSLPEWFQGIRAQIAAAM